VKLNEWFEDFVYKIRNTPFKEEIHNQVKASRNEFCLLGTKMLLRGRVGG
jgi:hypothetical protein